MATIHNFSGVTKSFSMQSDLAKNAIRETIGRLKRQYLPELRALLSDCNWLRTNLSIDGSRDLQPNEIKLLQFVALVESVIKEISDIREDVEYHGTQDLSSLETKIVKTILPVKARLHERWQQQKQEDAPTPSSAPPATATKGKAGPKPTAANANKARSKGKEVKAGSSKVSRVVDVKIEPGAETTEISSTNSIHSKQASQISLEEGSASASLSTKSERGVVSPYHSSANSSGASQVKPYDMNANVDPRLVPVGSLGISNYCPEAFHPVAVKNEDAKYMHYFVVDDDAEMNENIFDNMSDCGVDLYDDSEFSNYRVDLEASADKPECSISASNPHKRTFSNTLPSGQQSQQCSSLKKELHKPPGPYYSSAVDLDLKSSFAPGTITVREEEFMSSRRRRRLNQIVPNPRKPRQADYNCSICGEGYQCTVNDNPWWAVYKHECPHCKQLQVPRIDINLGSNAIELDPNVIALYGEGIEDSGEDGDQDDYSDEDEYEVDGIDGGEVEDGATEGGDGMGPAEEKAFDGEGLLAKEEASKLLVLMCHARTCNGSHASPKHAEICKSTKFLMLHIRDCKGTDVHGRECLFPWCKPCKKMLRHLTQCYEPDTCSVCNPWCLPESFQQLRKLNQMQFCQPVDSS